MMEKQESKKNIDDKHVDIRKLVDIGIALSAQKDINKLLEMIVKEARIISYADAGTLYTIENSGKVLTFRIFQNASESFRLESIDKPPVPYPPVPLESKGKPNLKNVSSYVAITGKSVNISDVYDTDTEFDFSEVKKYDEIIGYKTRSMLVIPLKNHKDEIIGILQLINALNPETKKIEDFSSYNEYLINSLASQAATALNNAQLIENLKELLSAIIKSMATAIDEKSPYTGGHIRRVVDLSLTIAKAINQSKDTVFGKVCFDKDTMEELKMAAWLHDVGKIVTPEHVIDKATKLEKKTDRINLIQVRFQLIETLLNEEHHRKKKQSAVSNSDKTQSQLPDKAHQEQIKHLWLDFEFIQSCNNTTNFMDDDTIKRLNDIAKKEYVFHGRHFPYIEADELENLCIRKGNLTVRERKIIEDHARVTRRITDTLPFPNELSRVPEIAASHHERPDGSGYPNGLPEDKLLIQSKILAIADIFEALTAKDRPYRKPLTLSKAIKIMEFMKKDNHIDQDIFDFFIQNNLHKKYAEKELNPEQIDIN